MGEVSIEEAGMRVSVRRTPEQLDATLAAALPSPADDGELPLPPAPRADGLTRVEAPMVGVFYRGPNPGAPAFVDVGDTIVPGQTLCLLEAMKLFNELKAETSGIVRAIHVENAQPVEYGQLLFEIDPVLSPPVV